MIPAFDCVTTIGEVVAGVRDFLETVIVVDDGSHDGTGERAADAGAMVVNLPVNSGKGVALRRGIEAALSGRPDALIFLDGDGQHDPADIPAFLGAWDDSRPDLVIGCRLGDPESIPGARYWTNYIGSRILSWMTGRDLDDSQSGYRLLGGDLASRLRLVAAGFAIESEMLIRAARLGARFEHVPVRTIYNDGGSHFRPVLDTFRISCASIYFKVFDDLDART